MQELRGKKIADKLKEECLAFTGAHNGLLPALAIVRVGQKPADLAYERSVKKRFIDYGLEAKDYEFPEDVSNEEFQQAFSFINDDPEINGILVMRPLPKQIDEQEMLNTLRPEKDLDGITKLNAAGVMMGLPEAFAPCTAQAVVEMLKGYDIPLAGKHVAVIGRSMVVGKPLSMLLLKENATVTVCHSKSENIKEITSQADILVAAIGKAQLIGSGYIKEDAVVIDVGINEDAEGKLCGDCNYETMATKASALTPVPGGVGTVTTAVLAKHLVEATARQLAAAEA